MKSEGREAELVAEMAFWAQRVVMMHRGAKSVWYNGVDFGVGCYSFEWDVYLNAVLVQMMKLHVQNFRT